MATAVVLSPLLLQQAARRVEALEIQRHYACRTTAGEQQGGNDNAIVVIVNEQMRRARTAIEEAGLYSSVWTWVPPEYYTTWSLQARADYLLKVPNANVDYLCKSLLLENKKVVEDDVGMMDRTNPKYILVVLQYAATLDVKKLITAIRAMRPNVHERLEEHQFDVRVATPEDNAILTGYEHNSVTPFGLLQPHRILIVLSKEVVPLRRFWMGGGHVNLKLSMAVSDFCKSGLNPMIADISNPRTTTGLELKNYNMSSVDAVSVLPHTESSSTANGGGGGAAPAGNGGTSTPSLAINQLDDAANHKAAAAAPAVTQHLIKEKKHKKRHKDKDKKKHRSSSSKKDKHNPDSPPSSSCASQTSEESKEKKVGEGYIVHVQWDDMDDHSAITSPAIKKKKDKDKKKKKKHRNSSKTVLEEEGEGVIVEESTTTSSSNKSHKSKDDHSASEPSCSAAESPKSSSKSPPPAAASSSPLPLPAISSNDHHPIMVPTLPNNNSNNDDDEDSPGKMHRFHLVGAAPALPVVRVPVSVQAQKPKISKSSRAMSSDLQAIMKRRREMAETLSIENTPTAALLDTTSTTKSHCGNDGWIRNKSLDRRLKTVGMSSDLQAIMARRRRLAGDADDDDDDEND